MWIYTSMYISNDSGRKSKTVIVLTLLFQDIFYSNLSLPVFSPMVLQRYCKDHRHQC